MAAHQNPYYPAQQPANPYYNNQANANNSYPTHPDPMTQPMITNNMDGLGEQKASDKWQDDVEEKEFMQEIRRGFIKKVYGILSVTLLFTALICAAPTTNHDVQFYMANNIWILIVAIIGSFIPLYALFCFVNVARRVPINYILLFAFVFCESILVAYCCASVSNPKIVLIAALMTMGLTIILTAFACTTKIDFTLCWGTLFILGGALLMFGLFAIILRSDTLYIAY